VDYPRAGAHYPRSTGEFLAWFRSDEDCLDYLEWLRWPGGFACPHCGHAGGWRLADGRIECGDCARRTSVTAGTIFDRTRTPLTVWFHACWLFATAKDGISAQYLQRSLEIGSYHTAWAMLHRLRSALVRPGRGRLAGTVEVDETFIGGEEHGLRGGRQPGKKVLTGIAVEISEPKGIGRCRMAVLADASAASLRPFVAGNVEPGARVITDGWVGYNGLAARGYDHERRNQKAAARRGEDPGELLPAVHRVSSLCKRWLLGTHQGRVEPAHLQAYLNEFTFRFNRRHSRSRGLVFYRVLELAAGHDPVRYNDIRAVRKPRNVPPLRRGVGHPPSLERPAASRPWRTSEMQLQFPLRLTAYPGLAYQIELGVLQHPHIPRDQCRPFRCDLPCDRLMVGHGVHAVDL
jgi:transposase-like protein